jgi:formylmethanofuran dehydrogenase subunit E
MSQVHDYTKTERFAVVRKEAKNRRYYANFKFLHETREAAEAEAIRLAGENRKAKFYVIEIQRIATPYTEQVAKPESTYSLDLHCNACGNDFNVDSSKLDGNKPVCRSCESGDTEIVDVAEPKKAEVAA